MGWLRCTHRSGGKRGVAAISICAPVELCGVTNPMASVIEHGGTYHRFGKPVVHFVDRTCPAQPRNARPARVRERTASTLQRTPLSPSLFSTQNTFPAPLGHLADARVYHPKPAAFSSEGPRHSTFLSTLQLAQTGHQVRNSDGATGVPSITPVCSANTGNACTSGACPLWQLSLLVLVET